MRDVAGWLVLIHPQLALGIIELLKFSHKFRFELLAVSVETESVNMSFRFRWLSYDVYYALIGSRTGTKSPQLCCSRATLIDPKIFLNFPNISLDRFQIAV